MDSVKMCFVIPVYNHGATCEAVIQSLKCYGLPFILVDDGNDEKNAAYIRECGEKHSDVTVVVRAKNGGKGKAFTDGVRKANEMGFTHVFQIDADGQHDSEACKKFIEITNENPDALICGYPVYDESVPKARKNGREFSNGWARIVTFNRNIKDVLCGFRVYPVASYMKVLNSPAWLNGRMGFDVDILVHLSWKGVRIINGPVKVTYPKDGVSNFHMVRDNIQISGTFTRLCFGMIIRSPYLFVQSIKRGLNEKRISY